MNKGYWEQEGKNPIVGAFVFVLLIGAVYFALQVIIMNLYILIDMAGNKDLNTLIRGGYMERIQALYSYYQKPILLFVIFTQFLVFIIPTIKNYQKGFNQDWLTDFQMREKPSLKAVLTATGGTLLFLPLADFLSGLFYRIFPGMEQWSNLQTPLFEAADGGSLFFLILAIGLTPALCEEFLFRGFFQSTLSRRNPAGRSIFITALIFGLYHQNPMGLFALTAAGIWLGVLSNHYKSLYASMIAHFVYNSTIILIVNGKIARSILDEQGRFLWPVTLVSSILFAALLWKIWPRKKEIA